mmetsp:Transcript_16594/g.38944  ORF Transcript_16594/g.38944 Transcript_16594/m.38944 type:complete len:418 (+) Transcript_16594:101-1354(+)
MAGVSTVVPVMDPADLTPAPLEHPMLDCWEACKGAGLCSWCGEGNSCCKSGNPADPPECRTATQFSTLHHECVRTMPLLMSTTFNAALPSAVVAAVAPATTTTTAAAAEGWSAGGFALMLLVVLGCCGAAALAFRFVGMGPKGKLKRKARSVRQDEQDSHDEVQEPLVLEQQVAGLRQSPVSNTSSCVPGQPALAAAVAAPTYTSMPQSQRAMATQMPTRSALSTPQVTMQMAAQMPTQTLSTPTRTAAQAAAQLPTQSLATATAAQAVAQLPTRQSFSAVPTAAEASVQQGSFPKLPRGGSVTISTARSPTPSQGGGQPAATQSWVTHSPTQSPAAGQSSVALPSPGSGQLAATRTWVTQTVAGSPQGSVTLPSARLSPAQGSATVPGARLSPSQGSATVPSARVSLTPELEPRRR